MFFLFKGNRIIKERTIIMPENMKVQFAYGDGKPENLDAGTLAISVDDQKIYFFYGYNKSVELCPPPAVNPDGTVATTTDQIYHENDLLSDIINNYVLKIPRNKIVAEDVPTLTQMSPIVETGAADCMVLLA
jgi:hypothetical protein